MRSRILEKIDELNRMLVAEHARLAEKYQFSLTRKRIQFSAEALKRHAMARIPVWEYAVPTSLRHFLSIPFIYAMIVPVVFLDAFITVYHAAAFPLYGIPKVKRRDYIVYDRQFLSYLNVIQKINCRYCTYVNGFFAYALEIAARTERYWCPLKAALKPVGHHAWYQDFADYGNPEEWKEKFNTLPLTKPPPGSRPIPRPRSPDGA